MALGHNPRLAEGVGDYPLHAISLEVKVKRAISYVFSFHNQREYRPKGYPCQPLKKIILSLDFGVKCDIINSVVNEKIKKPRAMVDWNTGQRVHRPKKGKGSYDRGVVKRQDDSLQKSN